MEVLCHADEGRPVLLERLHQLGKVQQRPAEPVDAMGQDAVDLPGPDVGYEALQRRAVQIAAAVAAVVIARGQRRPAGMGLAVDVRFGRLALGIQRVEVLVESFFGAFAGVDGAADRSSRRRLGFTGLGHDFCPFSVSPKKKCPEQCAPVTALATALRERYVRPSKAKPCSRTSTWSVRPL